MPASGYFAPTYYPPSFFGPLGAVAPGGEGSPMSTYRDRDAFAAIVNALTASAQFAEVAFPGPLDATSLAADRVPLAIIEPTQWSEQPDPASDLMLRRVSFVLTMIARSDDPRERFETLDRLTSIVQNAIEGSTLGGGCLAAMTHLRAGRYDPASISPELRLSLDGGFAYSIPSPSGHDVSR